MKHTFESAGVIPTPGSRSCFEMIPDSKRCQGPAWAHGGGVQKKCMIYYNKMITLLYIKAFSHCKRFHIVYTHVYNNSFKLFGQLTKSGMEQPHLTKKA